MSAGLNRSATLPAALVRVWEGEAGGEALAGAREATQDTPGVHWPDPRICAVAPVAGDPATFDLAAAIARDLLRRAAQATGTGPRQDRLLMLPGRAIVNNGDVRLVADSLLDDLSERPMEADAGSLYLTSKAATRLEMAYRLAPVGRYRGLSGVEVPLLRLGAEDPDASPWRNREVLRRHLPYTPRRVLEAALAGQRTEPVLRVTGPVGCGKSRAVWEALAAEGVHPLWTAARPVRHDGPSLAAQTVRALTRTGPEPAASGGEASRQAAELGRELAGLTRRVGRPAVLVCDALEGAGDDDLELLAELASAARETGAFRLVAVGRSGTQWPPQLAEAPEVAVPPLSPGEMTAVSRDALAGLALPDTVTGSFLEAAAGRPFALEEGLAAFAHLKLIRQIFGSFFFNGVDDTPYIPSDRLIQHAQAEARRVGALAPLLALTLGEPAVPAEELRTAALAAGAEAPAGWEAPFLEAGWLLPAETPWGPGVTFDCPALAAALRHPLNPEAAHRLRGALGEVLADRAPEGSWRAYRLLQGSDQATQAILDAARTADAEASPRELLEALTRELENLRRREDEDEAAELSLLWHLLPLAHREGVLDHYQADVVRAVELAGDEPRRLLAFASLKAELEQETGRLPEAEATLRRALGASAQSPEGARAMLLLRLARVLIRRERLEEAGELLEQVVPILDRQGATALAASGRFYLGNVARRQHRFREAVELHRRALESRRRVGQPKPIGASLSALGALAMRLGRYSEALDSYLEAGTLFEEAGDDVETSFAYLGIGRALSRLGDFAAAASPLRRALALREGREDAVGEAIARLAVAENHLDLEQLDAALREARKAHFDLRLAGKHPALGEAEQLLGRIQLHARHLAEAVRHLSAALEIHRQQGDDEAVALDLAWGLEAALTQRREEEVRRLTGELEAAATTCRVAARREVLEFRLFRGLEELSGGRPDSQEEARRHLRRAYRELMRKTGHLTPDLRHRFLFQIPDHQEIVDAATRCGLSWPNL